MLNLKPVDQPYVCSHCNSGFMKEKTLTVHMCEQKRRYLARSEKHVQIGYQAYIKFYQLTQRFQGEKTYDEFSRSPYYNAFIKFGSFVSNVNPLYPQHYIDWVVTSNVKLDHWCRQELYDKYVLELIKTENVETALQRTLAHMMDWAEEKNAVWNHYFDYVSLSRATFDIRDGKISPWVILNCQAGKTMLSKMNDEQLEAISAVIDPEYWMRTFRKQKQDVELVRQVLEEAKL
jgi:hypothetical protein